MYYIEQIYTPAQMVRITLYNDGITNVLMYRKYRKATPDKPLIIERLDGCMVCVDARETWEQANARAGEVARKNGTSYRIGKGVMPNKGGKTVMGYYRRKKDLYPPCDPSDCEHCTRPADMCHGGAKDHYKTPYKDCATRPTHRVHTPSVAIRMCSGSRIGGHVMALDYLI